MALAVVIVVGNLGMEIKLGNSGIREIWILRTDGPKISESWDAEDNILIDSSKKKQTI